MNGVALCVNLAAIELGTCESVHVSETEDALSLLNEREVALVIVRSDECGRAVLSYINESPLAGRIPSLAITDEYDEADARSLRALGASDVLASPGQYELAARAERAIAHAKAALERDMLFDIARFDSAILFNYDARRDEIAFSGNYVDIIGGVAELTEAKARLIERFHSDDSDMRTLAYACERARPGDPPLGFPMRIRTRDGALEWFEVSVKVQFGLNGELWGAFGRAVNVQRYMLDSRLSLARDALTDLLNAAETKRQADSAIANRPGASCSMLLLGIDGMREINAKRGPLLGDELIKRTASTLVKLFRSTDIVGRVGGDEFAVFMTNMDSRRNLERRAEQLMELVSRAYTYENAAATASVGIAYAPRDGRTYSELLERARAALAAAKARGGARCAFMEDDIESEAWL